MGAVIPLHSHAAVTWQAIGILEDIPRLGARVVKTGWGDIAVFRTRDDQVFALVDHCPHRGGPLSQGIVTGCQVICPLHDWCINLANGEAEAPDQGHTQSVGARLVDGMIYLALPA